MRPRYILPLLFLFAAPLAAQSDTARVRQVTDTANYLARYGPNGWVRRMSAWSARELSTYLAATPGPVTRVDTLVRVDTVKVTNTVIRVDTVRVLRVDTVRVTTTTPTPTPAPTPTPTPTPAPTPPPVDTAPPPVVVSPGAPAGTIFTHPFAPPANGALFAELPRDTVPLTVPAWRRTIPVVSLQLALDTARSGDRLLIPRNHRTEQLQVRPTSQRLSWVTIQGTDSTSVIGTSGTGAESAIAVLSRAHHVRFLGPLRITATGAGELSAMFRSYNGETTLDAFPHDILLDGVTFDGGSAMVRRCVWADGIRMAVVRSKLLGCATQDEDAQAILILGGPGPYRFESNYLEGSHQCFNSGGGDPAMVGLVPSDVVFRDNVCEKPMRWHYTVPNQYTGVQRQVKTIIETKNIRRALFEGNTLRNVWPDAQTGFAFLLKSVNQDGACTWCTTSDVTVRYNRVINAAAGFNLSANPQGIVVPLTRVSVYGNVVETFGPGDGIPLQVLGATRDVIVLHNTFATAGNQAVSFDEAPGIRTVIAANVIPHGQYGVKGNSTQEGTPTVTQWMPGGLFKDNVIPGSTCSLYPTSTRCVLSSPLPAATDGTPIGADLSKVSAVHP